jgi:Tfp pilus assembly protein PilW
MMVTLISSFVFAGVLSAYIFLGRSLGRQVNEQSLESRTRLALFWFTQDVSTASSVTAVNPGSTTTGDLLTLSLPSGSTAIYACDWSGGVGAGQLTRRIGSTGTPLVLLTNLSRFSFDYYDSAGNPITAPSTTPTSQQIDIKQITMTYQVTAGVAATGDQSTLTVVSPSVILKNKAVLVDPTNP